jgi:4-alpha-glucanotransferase
MLRSTLRRYGGLRVDHVMGLFRLFWIPEGGGPDDGTYVRYPEAELLDVVVEEVNDAGAFLVGEDLGTVETHVREAMAARGIGSMKVALFETVPPWDWPQRSLAMLTTHDLPTTRGLLDHRDPRWDERLAAAVRRFADLWDAEPRDIAVAAHRALGASRSDLAIATLEDLAWSAERVNLPGTVDEYPNWRVPLPVTVRELAASAHAAEIVEAISGDGRARNSGRP